MAYSPLEQTRLLRDSRLVRFASDYGLTPAQVALAWLLANDDVIAIPKSASVQRVQENVAAAEIRLDQSQLDELDRLFPPPESARPLEML
jgi:diketogulonate reductase-like aldo/keto reductase